MAVSTRTRRGGSSVLLALGLAVAAALPSVLSSARRGSDEASPPGPVASRVPVGAFTTQRSWLWCTAAGVQIVRNIVERRRRPQHAAQRRYFTWMREHNRYDAARVGRRRPAGWTAGSATSSTTATGSSRAGHSRRPPVGGQAPAPDGPARRAGRVARQPRLDPDRIPATADPARTAAFEVTSVRVVGPLYGLQSENGYDMRTEHEADDAQLKRFFTPWRYAPKRMIWDGRYVSIQPVPVDGLGGWRHERPRAEPGRGPRARARRPSRPRRRSHRPRRLHAVASPAATGRDR